MFITISRSEYGNRCDFKQIIVDYRENNCFNPTKIIVLSNVLTIQLVKITKNNI